MSSLRVILFAFLLTAGICYGQPPSKKIIGKWVTCQKIDALSKVDTVSFVKDDAATVSICVEKNCGYSRWTFEATDSKIIFFRNAGCKDAASVSEKEFNGTWTVEKDKKTLTVFDDHFTKHTYEIVLLTDKELKLKRVK